MDYEARQQKLQRSLVTEGLEALLVTNEQNVTYLTGFTGDSSYLLVTQKELVLVSDSRYTTQLSQECKGLKVHIRPTSETLVAATVKLIKRQKVAYLGIEGNSISISSFRKLEQDLPKVDLRVTSELVEALRQIKDKDEIQATRRAVDYAQRGFAILRASLRAEQTEREVANELEYQLRRLGAKGCSFPPIVAVGSNAALPHARPTERKIGEAPMVLVDWGADEGLYKSDLTRVLFTAKIPPKLHKIYGVVLTAQQRAIEAIRPGALCSEVDAIARDTIKDAGFERYFGHGLGHGVGLDIHEAPRLAPKQQVPLKAGMIVTVEPGIYLPRQFGVRIEDDVLVTKDGAEVLTSVPKNLEEMFVG